MIDPKVGDLVIFHDPKGEAHTALVICVFQNGLVNVVLPDPDESKQDSYGRQIKRETSVPYKDNAAHGFYWRLPAEEPNPHEPPIES